MSDSLKASFPIYLMLLGNLIDLRVTLANALSLIAVTSIPLIFSGITKSGM